LWTVTREVPLQHRRLAGAADEGRRGRAGGSRNKEESM
jgi:hypothetical protein